MYFYSVDYLNKISDVCKLNIVKDFNNIEIKVYEVTESDGLKLNVKIVGLIYEEQQFSIIINDILHSFSLSDKINSKDDIDIFKYKNIGCKFYHQEQIVQIILNDDITLTYPLKQVIVCESKNV